MWITAVFVMGWALLPGARELIGQEPERSAAGIVVDYHPPSAEHTVLRAQEGSREILGLGTPVYPGDRVTPEERGGLTLEFADGSRQSLVGPDAFLVPQVRPLGLVGRIVVGLRAQWARGPERGTTAATRGSGECGNLTPAEAPALVVPVLRPTTRIVAGERDLTLGWLGGCPPYRVRLTGPSGSVFEAPDLLRPVLRTDHLTLEPGVYRLAIEGQLGTRAAFDLVVEESLPEAPPELAEVDPGSSLGRLAHATWLAEVDEGSWRWESFQLLRPLIGEGYAMAGELGDLLMFEDADLSGALGAPPSAPDPTLPDPSR